MAESVGAFHTCQVDIIKVPPTRAAVGTKGGVCMHACKKSAWIGKPSLRVNVIGEFESEALTMCNTDEFEQFYLFL